ISSPVTIDVTASDATSGLAAAPSCLDGATPLVLTPGAPGTWTTTVAGDGSHAIGCSVDDTAGNTNSDSDTVTIDTVDPSISVSHSADGSNDWNISSPVTIDVTATDATSAIAAPPPSTVAGPPAPVTGSGPYSVAVAGEGSHPVSCSVDDTARNTNGDGDTVEIDLHPPTSPSIDSSDPVSSANNN